MGLYAPIADLPLQVDDYELRRRERDTSSDFTRVTTTFALSGGDAVGRGEDVSYEAADHDALSAAPPELPTGRFTFAEYAGALADVELFPEPPAREKARQYRRWAVESAALDLALRQADLSMGAVLDRAYEPVRFVASTRLGDGGFERIERFVDAAQGVQFKLDPEPDWSDDLLDRLADTGRVAVLDFKAHYEDAEVGVDPDPAFYRRVAERFPDAVLEDAALTEETRDVLAPHSGRLSWDVPVTGVDAIEALPVEPRWLNVKPSRFGSVASLFETVEYCADRGIRLYGGGQFELGVGRGHVQVLASLLYPDGPNDVAPRVYNEPELPPELPSSPIVPSDSPRGLGWE